jgi:hypothetical protein
MSDTNFFLSRIDRSVADNIKDIEKSFGEDAGIVKDFIVFISRKLKEDIFGYTRFTLTDFCRETGRNKTTLCEVHPKFRDNAKEKAPEYFGHKFETTFDYALFNMLQKNIIFSRTYDYKLNDRVVQLKNFPILKDIKLNVDRVSGTVKQYEIRASDELMEGFLQRYYTLDTNGYRHVGKGKGGDGRKSLFIFLYKTRHQCISAGEYITRFPVDLLCNVANITAACSRHRKQNVKRALDYVREKGNLPFEYKFVQGNPDKKYQELYWVEVDYSIKKELMQPRGEHTFYIFLFKNLQEIYRRLYPEVVIENEKDAFQRWLTNNKVCLDDKANEVCKAYFKAYSKEINITKAKRLIENGMLLV